MTADLFADLMGMLALVALLLTGFTLVSRITGRTFLTSDQSLWAAAAIAFVTAAGSLTMSDVFNFTPCLLCWWQRIFMYPLALLLPLAAARRDLTVRPYLLALALPGIAFGTWHSIVQRFPNLLGDSCGVGDSCAGIWVRALGVLTIPNMALIAFITITVLLVAAPDDQGTHQ
jgi:disulfide bond formation protein DsbB